MALQNKVVTRFRDGRIVKGFTLDFNPNKDAFHVVSPEDVKQVTEIAVAELKAIFYVKSFEGDSKHQGPQDFSEESLKGTPGLKLKVTFADGEVIFGTTTGYSPGRKGFFMLPADKQSNNDRVYVFTSATKSVETWR